MQGRVAEHGVEFVVEIERLTILHAGIETAFAGGLDLRGTGIDADDVAAHVGQLLRECPVTAAKIEDAFSRLRIQQLDHADAQVGDEAGVAGVAVWIPGLLSHNKRVSKITQQAASLHSSRTAD